MSFGCRTWSASGILEMDTDSFTYQVIHNQQYQVYPGYINAISIPEFNPSNCVASLLPVQASPDNSNGQTMPYVSVSVGTVTIRGSNPSESDPINTGSALLVRLLVMRYKN
jgi:hypothetical protein